MYTNILYNKFIENKNNKSEKHFFRRMFVIIPNNTS